MIGECDRETISRAHHMRRDRRTRLIRVPPRSTDVAIGTFFFCQTDGVPRVPPRRVPPRLGFGTRRVCSRGDARRRGGFEADPGRSGSSASGYRPQSRETRVASASSYLLRQDVRGVPGLVIEKSHPETPRRDTPGRLRRHRGRGGRDRLAILGAAPAEPVVAPEGDGREGFEAGVPRQRERLSLAPREIPDLGDVGHFIARQATRRAAAGHGWLSQKKFRRQLADSPCPSI